VELLRDTKRNSETMILLHYVKKKTQKLEKQDREIAEKRMMEVIKND
jgi:phage-related protein